MRRAGILAAATAVLLGTSACGGLSMESPVQPGLEVGAAQANPVRVLPPGPAAGSTPVQLVTGFLRAGAASDDEYEIARSFLSPAPEGTWRPDSSIMVFNNESALTVTQVDDTTVRASANVIANIDANGRYRDLPPGTTAETTFRIRQVSGQWRIHETQESFGLWLSSSDMVRLYAPFHITYISTYGRQLVPDVRWFSLGKGLATRLARAQLSAVPEYLQGAAKTDIPPGTRLTVDAVPIDNGLATVDLTASKPGGDPTRRQNLWAQFVETLTQVPDIHRVSLTVEGTALELPGLEAPPGTLADLKFPAPPQPSGLEPVLRQGSVLRHVDPEQVGKAADRRPNRDKDANLPAIPTGWISLAMSRKGIDVAAIGGDHTELSRWRGKNQIRVPAFGAQLTGPAYDLHDMLWVAGQSAGTRIWTINAAADPNDTQRTRPQEVQADWLAGRAVTALQVSPEGQRVALITTDAAGGDPHVDVAGVTRQPNGIPTELSKPLRVASTLTLARDLAWVDEANVAVLGRISAAGPVRPWIAQLGGGLAARTEVPGAVDITTTGGERGLVVTTDRNEVLVRAGSSWLPLEEGTDFMVPGT